MKQRSINVTPRNRLSQSGQPQSSKRSRKGCPECRRRKIKCDEKLPRCGQCQKADRNCQLLDSVFRPHAFPLKQNKQNAPHHAIRPDRRDWEGAAAAITQNELADQHQDVVDASRAVPNDDLYQDASRSSEVFEAYAPILSPIHPTTIENFPIETQELQGTAGQASSHAEQAANHPILQDGAFHEIPTVERSRDSELVASPLATNSLDANSTIGIFKDTQEELFLLRHYSECIAPWMDLLYRYEVFSREVLTMAREHPLLRYAACAVAAKQLGQMRSPVSSILRGKTQENIAATLARGRFGFLWYGAKYYEKAIQTLVKSIAPRDPQSTESGQNYASPAVSLSHGDLMIRAEGEDPIVRLLGTCILIQYEHLSANRDAWSGHLTGFSKLLDLIDDGKLLQPHAMFEQVYPFTKDIMEVKAGFWNFVVNDLEESFVSHRRTRIDTENLALWRNMGLLIEDDGTLTLCSSSNSLSTTPEHARDKVLSYTLIRLLCKLIDYLAPLANVGSLVMQTESNSANHGNADYIYLEHQFDSWFQILSPSFHPDGTFLTSQANGGMGSGLFERELWFSNDLCSTTMMYYHMARMLLLIHRPSDLLSGATSTSGGTSFDLLRAFRDIKQKLQVHASEVISIVRGTPCDAIKLRAIQPLYVAGRCCSDTRDRRLLIEMLRDIQDKLGIATEYRIKTLLQEWDILYETLGLEQRATNEEQLE